MSVMASPSPSHSAQGRLDPELWETLYFTIWSCRRQWHSSAFRQWCLDPKPSLGKAEAICAELPDRRAHLISKHRERYSRTVLNRNEPLKLFIIIFQVW